MSTLKVTTIIPDSGTNTNLSLDGKDSGKVLIVDDATIGGDLAVAGATTLAALTASGTPTFSSTNDISIGGNLLLTTDSKGVYLGVTSATAANLLDDYEEGTWTATLVGTTTNPSSAVTVTGYYTKIGNMCYVTAAFADVDTTGAAGGVRVTGMPFTQSPANQMTGNCTLHTVATVGSGVSNISPFFQGSVCDFYGTQSNAGWTAVTHNAGSGRYLYFTGFFRCA